MDIGLVTSDEFTDHVLPPDLLDRAGGHPERPDRIRAIHAALRQAGMMSGRSDPPFPIDFNLEPGGPPLRELNATEPAGDELLRLAHTEAYIRSIGQLQARGGGYADAGETFVGPRSDHVARLAVAAAVRGVDATMAGEVNRAFVAVRPPGHHAEAERAMGFCLYSTVAIAARYLVEHHGLRHVAIIDFDVHHGNGTQAVLWEDPNVLFISTHQDPRTLWPGSGYASETGAGAGQGTTLNLPLPPGSGDDVYLRLFDGRIGPLLESFCPQMLLISAGFDAHAEDPLAHMAVTENGYNAMGRKLATWADHHCDGRLVAVLEGGYNLRTLGRSVVAFIRGLAQP